MKLKKCKKHKQDLFYLIESGEEIIIMCQCCFDEKVTAGKIKLVM